MPVSSMQIHDNDAQARAIDGKDYMNGERLRPVLCLRGEGYDLTVYTSREALARIVEAGQRWLKAHPIEDGAEAFNAEREAAAGRDVAAPAA